MMQSLAPRHFSQWQISEWLYHLEHQHAQEIQLGLDRIKAVADILALCHPEAVVITVAGTNGKGSTVAALEELYTTAGYKVGTYTSPHLIRFNERIRVNKRKISNVALCHAFTIIETARGEIPITYFEMTTLAALWHFKQHALDIILLEVGMGGRLDATNIIDADLAIVTSITLDHQAYLGETRALIGLEKVEIARSDRPLIYIDDDPLKEVVERAQAIGAIVHQLNQTFNFTILENRWVITVNDYQTWHLPLPAIHLHSAAAAIKAVTLLHERLPVALHDIEQSMRSVFVPARQQLVSKNGIHTLYDVAHNEQSAAYLAALTKTLKTDHHVFAVFAGLVDKDLAALVAPFKSLVDTWFLAQLDSPRATSETGLRAALIQAGVDEPALFFSSPVLAYEEACQSAEPGDLIVVYGSFITVGAVLSQNHEDIGQPERI